MTVPSDLGDIGIWSEENKSSACRRHLIVDSTSALECVTTIKQGDVVGGFAGIAQLVERVKYFT